MAVLTFFLECAAVAGSIAVITSALTVCLWLVFSPWIARRPAHTRAEAALVVAVLPALIAVAGVSAAALPPLLGALGLASDHCLQHLHHPHLCIMHSAGVRPGLALLGAVALAGTGLRALALLAAQLELNRNIRALVQVARPVAGRARIVEVPGEPRLCHAVGAIRGRVLLSGSLRASLRREHLEAALAHEEAHLARRDPLANLGPAVAAIFHLPGGGPMFARAYRNAAEEACDDHAALAVGDGAVVAEALLAVAAAQRGTKLGVTAVAFGEELEQRVRRLLGRATHRPRKSHAFQVTSMLAGLVWCIALLASSSVHHAIETVLHHLD
jgi:Zn-dependent protease with chaperone function